MKLSLLILLLVFPAICFSQDTTKTRSEYISIMAEGFARTSTVISGSDRSTLENSFLPGVSLGVEYSRISTNGLTFVSGLRARIIPVSFRFTVKPEDFSGPSEWTTAFTERGSSYSFPHLYVPFQLGYTFKGLRRNWRPTLLAGTSFSLMYSYEYLHTTWIGEPGDYFQIFSLQTASPSPQKPVWISYTLNGSVVRELKNGDRFTLGLVANLSGTTIYDGYYIFYMDNIINEGTYKDKGGYIGLQFGYSFARRHKAKPF